MLSTTGYMIIKFALVPASLTILAFLIDSLVFRGVIKTAINRRSVSFIFIMMLLLGNSSGVISQTILLFLGVFYATNLVHYGFFSCGLQPALMIAIFNEREDIFLTLAGNWYRNVVYIMLAAVFFVVISFSQKYGSSWGVWPALAIAIVFVVQGYTTKSILKFEPRRDLSVLENAIRAFQGFIFRSAPEYFSGVNIKFVDVEEVISPITHPDRDVVVLIIGESMSSNRMSIFGYEKDTTSFMRKMREEGKGLFLDGYASATSTVSATTALLLVLNDPRDINGLKAQNANLFRLAKQSGFRTHYLSAQRSKVVDRIDTSSIDEFRTIDSDKGIAENGETEILKRIKGLDPQQKHFVVIHMRIGHSPYDYYKKILPDLQSGSNDPNSLENYENSVRTVDWFVEQIVSDISSSARTYDLFFTSDHGELFGEQGLYGHAMLNFDVSRVPLALISSERICSEKSVLGQCHPPNHYDLARATARALGWNVKRGGEETGYVNGIGYAGSSGLLHYPREQSKSGLIN